jgi:hypothetical protein
MLAALTKAMPSARKPRARARRCARPIDRPRMPPVEHAERSERFEANESTEALEAAEPIENSEQAEPIDPIEATDPTEPTERIEPSLAIDRIESVDFSDQDESTDAILAGRVAAAPQSGSRPAEARNGPCTKPGSGRPRPIAPRARMRRTRASASRRPGRERCFAAPARGPRRGQALPVSAVLRELSPPDDRAPRSCLRRRGLRPCRPRQASDS